MSWFLKVEMGEIKMKHEKREEGIPMEGNGMKKSQSHEIYSMFRESE